MATGASTSTSRSDESSNSSLRSEPLKKSSPSSRTSVSGLDTLPLRAYEKRPLPPLPPLSSAQQPRRTPSILAIGLPASPRPKTTDTTLSSISPQSKSSAPAGVGSTHARSSSTEQAPAPLAPHRRALSFRIPVRVNTDPTGTSFPQTKSRSRASSLPEPSPGLAPEDNNSASNTTSPTSSSSPINKRLSRYSLSSIGEDNSLIPNQEPPRPDSFASNTSSRSPTEQFLFDRGLLSDEPLEDEVDTDTTSREYTLQEQLANYLATMSSPQKAPIVDQVAQAATNQYYQQQSNPNNMRVGLPTPGLPAPMPGLSGNPNGLVGNLLKGPVGPDGKLKDAALMVGIKLDLEAEVHLTARIRGDILVGLY